MSFNVCSLILVVSATVHCVHACLPQSNVTTTTSTTTTTTPQPTTIGQILLNPTVLFDTTFPWQNALTQQQQEAALQPIAAQLLAADTRKILKGSPEVLNVSQQNTDNTRLQVRLSMQATRPEIQQFLNSTFQNDDYVLNFIIQ